MTIYEFFKQDRYAAYSNVELLEVKKGYARARMKIEEHHLNGANICQGGAIFTLADLAFAAAANSHAILTVSINSSVNFFRGESEGYLYATAREMFTHSKMCNCEVHITNEKEQLVATFNATGYRKDKKLPFEPIE